MGLFDKKYCDVCGEKISLLGNRKVDDGNLCKECAKKLSPWFSERRHSTIESIKEQLNYRMDNLIKTADFYTSRTIGEHYKLIIDDINHKFAVGTGAFPLSTNPDILDFSQAAGIDLKIDESRREIKRTVDGRQESYNPPKYEYSYTFRATIHVTGNPYFDEMSFSISNGSVNTGEHNMSEGFSTSGWSVVKNYITAPGIEKYQKYINIGNEMKEAIEAMRTQGSAPAPQMQQQMQPQQQMQLQQPQFQPQQQMQPQQPQFQPQQQMQPQVSMAMVTCPYCGSAMTPTADGHCSVCNAPL